MNIAMQSALCTDWLIWYISELTGLADVAAEEGVDVPSELAEGNKSCSGALLWPEFDASGADKDFHRSLLVFSVFRRGVKVHAASAAASRSFLRASVLHMGNCVVLLSHSAVCLVVSSSSYNHALNCHCVVTSHMRPIAECLLVEALICSSKESAAGRGIIMTSLRALGMALGAVPYATKIDC